VPVYDALAEANRRLVNNQGVIVELRAALANFAPAPAPDASDALQALKNQVEWLTHEVARLAGKVDADAYDDADSEPEYEDEDEEA